LTIEQVGFASFYIPSGLEVGGAFLGEETRKQILGSIRGATYVEPVTVVVQQ